ncbi:MAG: Tad domain-containing protein [Planctomycetales bacterium]
MTSNNRTSTAPAGRKPPHPDPLRLHGLHRNESGTISIVSVFAIFMFTVLLAMVTNVAKHVDDKVRVQNAADASTYTGSVVMARGMNTLAFTNHLLCEVFALTAYMREGYARGDGSSPSDGAQNVESLVPEILDVWEEIGPVFQQHGASSGYAKFERLGIAITAKVPHERALVEAWGQMTYHHAELTLPVLEHVLSAGGPTPEGGLIPRFQRQVVQRVPRMAELAVAEVAARNGAATERTHSGRSMEAFLWRTDVRLVDFGVDQTSVADRTLPAVDPTPNQYGDDVNDIGGNPLLYFDRATVDRAKLSQQYLGDWINAWMGPYFGYGQPWPQQRGRETAKMSQFRNLWLQATQRRLNDLLTIEYPETNLPHVIRHFDRPIDNARLDEEYTFVGVAHWRHVDETFPGLFVNRIFRDGSADTLAFAQATVFLPSPPFNHPPWGHWSPGSPPVWIDHYEDQPTAWALPPGLPPVPPPGQPNRGENGLFSQNWSAKLVPADIESLPAILQTPPPGQGYRLPNLGGASIDDLRKVNFH